MAGDTWGSAGSRVESLVFVKSKLGLKRCTLAHVLPLICSQKTYSLTSGKLFHKITNTSTNVQTAVSFLIAEDLGDMLAAGKIEK